MQLRDNARTDRAEIERFQDAAYKGDLKQLKYFISNGYSPTLGDTYNSTTLISAILGA